MTAKIVRHGLAAVLGLLATMPIRAVAAMPAGFEKFYGEWAGTALSDTGGEIAPRDIQVKIAPQGNGFALTWVLVIHKAATALAAHPRRTLETLEDVLAHPLVLNLQSDAVFWQRVEAGDVDAALELPSARALVLDAELRGQLASLGLVDAAAATQPAAFERALSDALDAAARRLAELRSDPEMRALLEDPEVQGLVERRDAFGLLTHPRFQSLIRRATAS